MGLFVCDKSGSTGPSLVHIAIVWRGRSVHVQDALWVAKTNKGFLMRRDYGVCIYGNLLSFCLFGVSRLRELQRLFKKGYQRHEIGPNYSRTFSMRKRTEYNGHSEIQSIVTYSTIFSMRTQQTLFIHPEKRKRKRKIKKI